MNKIFFQEDFKKALRVDLIDFIKRNGYKKFKTCLKLHIRDNKDFHREEVIKYILNRSNMDITFEEWLYTKHLFKYRFYKAFKNFGKKNLEYFYTTDYDYKHYLKSPSKISKSKLFKFYVSTVPLYIVSKYKNKKGDMECILN